MTEGPGGHPPQRVRVTAPRPGAPASAATGPTPGPVARRAATDVQGVYVRSLIRSQLRLALVCAAAFAVATVLFVLAIVLTPALDEAFVAGVPVSWLLLGFGVYPLALTIGGLYVRAASRNEARYRSLVEDS
ncbi:DUF485 domain-containing protein [Agromyces sp. G08B096]|uniref:DUF485 domain-containing protein n=1 Tax=Agromyces sp. G08B096 TaxID=3156399 RepID=A0AAU7W9I7_9MICO